MENDLFLPLYFNGLYHLDEYDKIDLWDPSFYRDTLEFYCKNEDKRINLIKGIGYLCCKIKIEEDLQKTLSAWAVAENSMNVRYLFAEFHARKESKPNLVTEFKDEVNNILEKRMLKFAERRILEQTKIRELKIVNKALVNSYASNENISQNKKTKVKDNRPFFKHLLYDKPEELSEICKSTFNKNNSPKDYAIMLCLLSENKYVIIPNKARKFFFEAWYKFINKQVPDKDNYYAINKYIIDKAANGFVFKDETDPDYCNLKEIFDKELINSNLH